MWKTIFTKGFPAKQIERKESYHYLRLSQNTNLQLNFHSNTQLDLIL